MHSEGQKVEFTPPKGFQPPEGSDGQPFSLVCDFEVRDGKLCLKMLGDTPMPGYDDDKSSPTSKPDYSGYSGGMMAAGSQPGGEQ